MNNVFKTTISMKSHSMPGKAETAQLNTAGLRSAFLQTDLFVPGELHLTYTDLDRAIVGGACPTTSALDLPAGEQLKAEFFCQRREIGVINLGAAGSIVVDGSEHQLNKLDCLYIGRGSRKVTFKSATASEPAAFYIVSYPAHADYPTKLATPAQNNQLKLGSKTDANERTINQVIHENGIKSCQLVLGFTELAPGSIWNTMPSHTHDRRSEVYCYFDIPAGHAVLHMMGEPAETRPLWVNNHHVVLSPSWSIHSGVGTNAYRFVWAMGGENQRFDDMDKILIPDLR
jgi:4-deoxy-L-threo-5-hexosulose-uronate ketol-isomerase